MNSRNKLSSHACSNYSQYGVKVSKNNIKVIEDYSMNPLINEVDSR